MVLKKRQTNNELEIDTADHTPPDHDRPNNATETTARIQKNISNPQNFISNIKPTTIQHPHVSNEE